MLSSVIFLPWKSIFMFCFCFSAFCSLLLNQPGVSIKFVLLPMWKPVLLLSMSRYREYSSPCDTQLHSNSLVAGSKMDTSHAGHYRTDPSVSSISPHYHHIPHGSYKSKDDSIAVDIYNHGPNLPRKSSQSGATDSFKGTEDVLKDTSMEILCFDLTSLPRGAQFLLCCGSVFFFYVIYGYFMVSQLKENFSWI